MRAEQPLTTLEKFFSGLAEHTFEVKLGIVDPPLIDYLSGLLVRSVRTDQVQPVAAPHGQAVKELGRLLSEADRRTGIARRRIFRHVGDFALFWAGLFPEHLRSAHSDADIDLFGEYCLHGKHAYLVASSIRTAEPEDAPPADLLERLGLAFEMCAYGLREVRREWEQADDVPPAPLIA